MSRLDFMIFGASGFTGQHVIDTVYKLCKSKSLTFGLSGRSENKIKEILPKIEKRIEASLSDIPIIVADVKDEDSLKQMAKRAKIVLNCSGPYRFLGEAVVKACLAEGAHHVDVSGEPAFMEKMQLKYHNEALEKGVYIVSACGLDSIPCDLGIEFLKEKFPGVLNSVESYLEFGGDGSKIPGPSINYGTWETAVHSLANANELREVRSKLYPTKLPKLQPLLPLKSKPHRNPIGKGWAVPFPGADRAVCIRSQRHFFEVDNERPIQVQTYFVVKKFWYILILALMGSVFTFLCKFKFGRNLLLKYPSWFSFGVFSHEQPSEEKLAKSKFRITFKGEGWKDKLSRPTDQYTSTPDLRKVARVEGDQPGYGCTANCITYSAYVILTEKNKLPNKGGVYAPGAAFAKTSLISLLNDNGLKFSILDDAKL